MDTLDILDTLLSFDTTSVNPNRSLIDFVQERLNDVGAHVQIIEAPEGGKANLYATIGPTDKPGVLLSGHTDVVPVDGQDWSVPPFAMTVKDGRAYGRGAADMKGFVACALSAAIKASRQSLETPLHLAFSYDEEIGCVGVRSIIDMLAAAPFRPSFCIVGEPTSLAIATGHKGKTACRVVCTGRAAHSALAPTGLNAIHLATDFIAALRELQLRLATTGSMDDDYDVPYTTVHVGKITGGMALNIVPDHCELLFEIRNLAQDDPEVLLAEIKDIAARIATAEQARVRDAAIEIEVFNTYPGLDTAMDAQIVSFMRSLTDANHTMKVAFGTEGGLFSSRLGIPTVVCGPGSMEQGHKADEFVSLEQLERCDTMLGRLVTMLQSGSVNCE